MEDKIEDFPIACEVIDAEAVSYTHLDVYKRQGLTSGVPVEPPGSRPGSQVGKG